MSLRAVRRLLTGFAFGVLGGWLLGLLQQPRTEQLATTSAAPPAPPERVPTPSATRNAEVTAQRATPHPDAAADLAAELDSTAVGVEPAAPPEAQWAATSLSEPVGPGEEAAEATGDAAADKRSEPLRAARVRARERLVEGQQQARRALQGEDD